MILYDFSPEINEMISILLEDPEDPAANDTLQMLIETDIDTACRVMREAEAQAEAQKKEGDFFVRKARQNMNLKKHMRGKMLKLMLLSGKKQIKTAENTISVTTRNNFVLDVDVSDLPDEFKKVTIEPRLQAITDEMKKHDRGWGHFEQTESLTVR